MIDINELRDGVSKFGGGYLTDSGWSDLIDRLEAAEKDVAIKEEVIDSLAAVVKRLDAQCDAAEKAVTEAYRRGYATGREEIEKERDALRAKVAEMEKQEPVASIYIDGKGDREFDDWKCDLPAGSNLLYALPGAQPAPSVPEDVMRDAERYRYLRARDDGTVGVGCWIEADGRVCDRGWLYGVQLDSAIDSFIEVLAAAPKPEVKP